MRKFCLLGLLALTASTVHASGTTHGGVSSRLDEAASIQSALARSLSVRLDQGLFGKRLGGMRAAVQVPTGQATPDELAVPASVLTSLNGVQADVTSGQGPFKNFHQSYAGFQGAVAAQFNQLPIMTLFYQGSVFSDSASAAAYMAEGLKLTNDPTPPVDCSSQVNDPCQVEAFISTTNQATLYSVVQVNYCTIEVGFEGDPTQVTQNQAKVDQTAAGLENAAIAQAQSVCVATSSGSPPPTTLPTVFSVTRVSVHKGSKQTNSTLHSVRSGHKFYIFVNWTLSSAPDGSKPAYQLYIHHGGRIVAQSYYQGQLSAYPDGTYYTDTAATLSGKGTYKIVAEVIMNNVVEKASAKIKVT